MSREFWQEFNASRPPPAIWTDTYDAAMPDGSVLVLPLRDLGLRAVAGLIANQASFTVVDRLSHWMAEAVAQDAADIVVGLPTLGHVFGQGVARALGHTNWVAPGTTRKLWYDEALSIPTASITSPEPGRRMWLDPRLLDRLAGRRILLVDDVISTGRSALAGLSLLAAAGMRPVAACVAMAQTERWRAHWPGDIPLRAAFATPEFTRHPDGWRAPDR
jgi:adenine/guanine phosphoribosyltransferase-like PRPP-binding protein